MNLVRSLLFVPFLYLSMVLIGVCGLPLMVTRRSAMWVIKAWAYTALWGARWICGIRIEVRGLEHAPKGAALVGAKHQSMLDTLWPFTVFDTAIFVLKKELMWTPVLGWYAWRVRMIPVDRAAAAAALKKMVRDVRDRLTGDCQIIIYPEGTRTRPGQRLPYKHGAGTIQRATGLTIHPVAVNCGLFWPRRGIPIRGGVAVIEFLEPLPAGARSSQVMELLENRIEPASERLFLEAGGTAVTPA